MIVYRFDIDIDTGCPSSSLIILPFFSSQLARMIRKTLKTMSDFIPKSVKGHALTITMICCGIGMLLGAKKLGGIAKTTFGQDPMKFHDEMDDFLYAQEMKARREKARQ